MKSDDNNTCIMLKGPGPFGEICLRCQHLRGVTYKDVDIYVCDLTRQDINPYLQACGGFAPKS